MPVLERGDGDRGMALTPPVCPVGHGLCLDTPSLTGTPQKGYVDCMLLGKGCMCAEAKPGGCIC